MSRTGTPTDNPIIESLNGWIKEELKIDFDLTSVEGIPSFIENYVHYFNNERLSYKLKYQTPVQYRLEQGFGQLVVISVYFYLTSPQAGGYDLLNYCITSYYLFHLLQNTFCFQCVAISLKF